MDKSTNASHGPPRQRASALKAVSSFAHQLDSDEGSDLEMKETIKDKVLASMRKERAEVKAQYGKNKFHASASSINGSPITYHGSDAAVSTTSVVGSTSSQRPDKKGSLYISTDPLLITESDVSDLTSLASSTTTSPIDNLVSRPPLCTPPKLVPLAARRGFEYGQLGELNEPAWSVNELGSYVWVLLEPKSNRVYNPDRDDCKKRLWWPAKILSRNTDVHLKVSLFGSGSKKVEIETPSAKNILSKLDMLGRPRFAKPTFVPPSSISLNEPTASPRKKVKRDQRDLGDIEKQWETAVSEMIQDGEEQAGSDHLPDIGEAFNYQFDVSPAASFNVVPTMEKGSSKRKGKRKRTCDSEDDVFWEPPPADASLDIPGELILGREKASKTCAYWPAKIKDYVPPTKRTELGKYTVIWLDASEQNIPRDWFYTTDEDGFALCTLGKFESSVSEILNDEDEDEDFGGSASPVPLDRPPNVEEFSNLSIREQFVYTKTVLQAIMNDEYEPTRSKHSRFMDGGKQRASLTDEAALRGKMDPKDVERLQTYIRQWCLREEAPADIFVDEIENHNIHPGAITDFQEEFLINPGLDHIRSGSHPLSEPDPMSLPPSSSCPSISLEVLEHESALTSDILPDASPSVTEPEAPPSSAPTEPMMGRPTSNSPLPYVKMRPAKQQGCEEYESLSRLDKIEYCLNILLPEAVRQILLWRSGKRTSMQLLSSEEEEDLYQEGQTLLNETDWVFDIMRYRQMKQRKLQSKNPKGKNGTTSRPSRGFNAPNYAE